MRAVVVGAFVWPIFDARSFERRAELFLFPLRTLLLRVEGNLGLVVTDGSFAVRMVTIITAQKFHYKIVISIRGLDAS